MTPPSERLERLWTLGILTVSIASLLLASLVSPRKPSDGVDHLIFLYGRAAEAVPGDGPVGFLAGAPDPPGTPATFFLAQYALAPQVVTLEIDDSQFVVSSPGATAELDGNALLSGFSLQSIHPGGIRIYVRRDR